MLAEAVQLQWRRLQDLKEVEDGLKIPLPGFRKEVLVLKDLLVELVQSKIELVYAGYERARQRMKFAEDNVLNLDLLSPDEREAIVELGDIISRLIESVRKPSDISPITMDRMEPPTIPVLYVGQDWHETWRGTCPSMAGYRL